MRPKTRPGFHLIAVFTLLLLGSALFKHASFSVLAQGANPASLQPVVLSDVQQKYPLGLHMQILEDPGGELTIEDVASSAYDTKFTQSKTEVPIYGFSNSAYWVRFRLDNQTPSTNRWLLQLAFPNMHYVDLYLPTPDGKDWITKQSGNMRPVSNRDILHRQILFELPQQAQEESTYYLRFQNGASMTLPLFVWQPEAFFRTENTAQYFFGLYYGALLMILIYNLFVFLSLRETSHFYYICFLSSIILYFFSYDGFAALYMWPGLDSLNDLTSRFFFLTTMASILMFTDSFLEIKKKHPNFHTVIMFMLAGWGILFLSIFWTNYHTTARLAAPFAVLSLGVAAISGLISLRDGFRPARFFLLSWLGFLIPSISVILVREGLIPSTNINENLFRVGGLWLASFWSLSLTDRVNLLKKETESANRLLRNSESKLSQILDGLPWGWWCTKRIVNPALRISGPMRSSAIRQGVSLQI